MAFATLPMRFEEFKFEIPEPFEATSKPWTLRPVSVPTLVMFGWAAWVTTREPPGIGPTTFEPVIFESPEAFPTWRLAERIPATVSPVSVPTLVMLG